MINVISGAQVPSPYSCNFDSCLNILKCININLQGVGYRYSHYFDA